MFWPRVIRSGLAWVTCLLASAPLGAVEAERAGLEFFENKVRPVLAENCYSCHGEEKQKGGLRLDSSVSILAGGDGGPVIAPGDTNSSRLLLAVSHSSDDLKMPPKKKLAERQIADLIGWVAMGAPMPTGGVATVKREFKLTPKDREHWSLQPIHRPSVPQGAHAVDALVLERLREKGLGPNGEASPRELIRRAYFDLIGLPPSPEMVEAFEQDSDPLRWEKLIDRLLSMPQYGERWGRHWLDVVRFAQSNGYERDGEMPLAWRYRDYVIKAFNDDKPYDRFVMEQLAGDELPDATADSVTATAFQRLGVYNDEPDDKLMAEFDALDDIVSTTGAAFLGLTLGCARCHDHKFDPISQADYYSMVSFFRGVQPYASLPPSLDSPGFAALAPPMEFARWLASCREKLKPLEQRLEAVKDDAEKKRLQEEIEKIKAVAPFEWTLAVRETGATPPVTRVLARGNASSPGAEVEPAFPAVFASPKPVLTAPPAEALTSGRRLVLAKWIASPENPLTARVLVNRVWQHHFGTGLVRTTTDFGRVGSPPTHPELLDWLAADFMDSGWSLKRLHRRIMLSETYRRSSRADQTKVAVDPANTLLWRQNLRRLEAEAVRDTILSVAGTLNPKMGGRGFFPHLGGEVLAGQSRPGLDWEPATADEECRRSVYAYVRRTMTIPLLDALDYSNTTSPLGERPTTTVAPQALMLLNDEFQRRQAGAFAARLLREAGADEAAQIRQAYRLGVNRNPTPREIEIAHGLLRRQEGFYNQLKSRLTFRPDVSEALSTDYFTKLKPDQFLLGPGVGWTYHSGTWAGQYEGIRVLDTRDAPFALWSGADFQDVIVEARWVPAASTEFAGLLLRATTKQAASVGMEVLLDFRGQRLALLRHSPAVEVLGETKADLGAGRAINMRVEAGGERFRVWLNGAVEPALDVRNTGAASRGSIGVRTWGGAVSIDDLAVASSDDGPVRWTRVPSESAPPARKALEAFCLMVLNLNEVIYVD